MLSIWCIKKKIFWFCINFVNKFCLHFEYNGSEWLNSHLKCDASIEIRSINKFVMCFFYISVFHPFSSEKLPTFPNYLLTNLYLFNIHNVQCIAFRVAFFFIFHLLVRKFASLFTKLNHQEWWWNQTLCVFWLNLFEW